MTYDTNSLHRAAATLVDSGKYAMAIDVYLEATSGDPTFDAGWYAERIGYCYEQIGSLNVAKYWFGVAVSQNPHVEPYVASFTRLKSINVDLALETAHRLGDL